MDILSRLFESLIVTLREGIEVALVVGILLAYLRRTGCQAYARAVFLGLAAAILTSLLGAVLIHRYGLNPDNPTAEGTLMFVAAALVTSLVVWMWKTGRSIKRRLEQRLGALVGPAETCVWEPRAALGVFAFTYFMMLREGVETVLFLAALSGTAGGSPLYSALGGSLGLLLATLFGVLLVRGSFRLNLRRFFGVTGIVLLILVAKLIAGGLHEFFEVGLLPSTPLLEELVEFFTGRTTSLILLFLLMALPGACMIWDWWKHPSNEQVSLPPQPNGARG